MKTHSISIIGLILLGILMGANAAMGYTIDDTYWGGATFGSQDDSQTGPRQPSTIDYYGSEYDIKQMNVTVTGNRMTVEIVGTPFNTNTIFWQFSGDLYISSTGWQVSNKQDDPANSLSSGHDPYDIFGSFAGGVLTNSENWNYVVGWSGSPFVPGNMVGTVYALDFSKITFSQPSGGGLGRNDQAWTGGFGTSIESADVAFGTSADGVTPDMTFSFDISPSSSSDPFLKNSTNVGLHWTMGCGNDVIEGNVPLQVPEPSTLLLLGIGLAGLGAHKRQAVKR